MHRSKLKSLATHITYDIFSLIKSSKKSKFTKTLPGRMKMYDWNAFVSKMPDIPDEECGFVVKVKVKTSECDFPIVDAQVGEKIDGEICMWINITIANKKQLSKLYAILVGVIRHEIEHLTMGGSLSMRGPTSAGELATYRKSLHDINRRRILFSNNIDKDAWLKEENARCEAGRKGDIFSYLTCYEELGPFVAGFHTQACIEKVSFEIIAAEYIDSFIESKQITETHAKIALGWFKIWEKDKYRKSH